MQHEEDTTAGMAGTRDDHRINENIEGQEVRLVDEDGQMDTVEDQAHHVTSATYDIRGLLTSVTVPHDPGGTLGMISVLLACCGM